MALTPSRRNFIRVLGGSAIAAIAPPFLAACSTDFPDPAVAPWRGPPADAELRRWAIGYAILAPNSHNRQPWLADLREPDAIVLRVDRERLLPETDPWFRQIVVSQGTFLEALVLALGRRGLVPEVRLFPEGAPAPRALDDRPVARVTWRPASGAGDPLFDQLLRRQTAKVDYDTDRPVAAATLDALRAAVADPSVRVGGSVEPARVEALRILCRDAARVELLTPRTVMESIRLTRVGPAEIGRHRDGIALNERLPRLADAFGAFDRSRPPAAGSVAERQMLARFDGHARSAMGFVWLTTRGGGRADEVAAGRAYLRLQLKATELGVQVHPMSQAIQEFAEMKASLERAHALLGTGAGETIQMLCRVGYAPAQAHTPRRGVEAIVRA